MNMGSSKLASWSAMMSCPKSKSGTKYRLAYLWGNPVVLDRPAGRVLPKQARDGLEQARFAAVEQTSMLEFIRLVQKECN